MRDDVWLQRRGFLKYMTLPHSLDHSKDEKSGPLTSQICANAQQLCDVGCRRPIP